MKFRLTCRSASGCPSMTCKILHLKIKGINHLDLIEEKRTVSLFSCQVEFSEAIESLLLMFKNCFYGIAFSSDKQAQAKPKIGYKEECFFTEQEYGQTERVRHEGHEKSCQVLTREREVCGKLQVAEGIVMQSVD